MSLNLKVTSRKNKSKKITKEYLELTQRIVASASLMVRNTAVKSIQDHGSSGRTYGKHTASTEGNPPNSDTGFLASNIHSVFDNDKLGSDVESRADYSEHLEFGTKNMRARPFLQPALEENRPKIKSMYRRLKARGV